MMDLGPLPGNLHSIATGINSAGQITGISYDLGSLFPQAFFWDGGILSPIGPFSPNAINDAGFVVGTQDTLRSDGIWQSEAVMWNGSTINGLGTLGGDNSYAHGINIAGDVVGVSQLADGTTTRAFLSASGLISDLGTLGGVRSHAYSINDQRRVVGVADNAAGSPHAFLLSLMVRDKSSSELTSASLAEATVTRWTSTSTTKSWGRPMRGPLSGRTTPCRT